MSLNVALIDQSEVIKKMISHCLHYYSAEVHRFETLDDFKSQSNHIKPDIVFMDWEINKEGEPLAISAEKEIKNIPFVVIYRQGNDEKINTISNRIKKPLDANILRKMVQDLVPKVGQSKIHKFLDFPQKEHASKPATQATPKTASKSLDLQSIQNQEDETPKKTSPAKKEKKPVTVKKQQLLFDKDSIDLDESTFNDFAPMAVKTSEEEIKTSIQIKEQMLNPDIILNVLNEYKNTLEFETLMEKILKVQAQNLSQKILKKDEDQIVSNSIEAFKKTEDFKQIIFEALQSYIKNHSAFRDLFEKELRAFVNQSLPNLAKTVIEAEIKELLEDNH